MNLKHCFIFFNHIFPISQERMLQLLVILAMITKKKAMITKMMITFSKVRAKIFFSSLERLNLHLAYKF